MNKMLSKAYLCMDGIHFCGGACDYTEVKGQYWCLLLLSTLLFERQSLTELTLYFN